MNNMEIKQGDIVVLKTGNRAFEVIGKYIVLDDRLWRVDAITEHDPPTPDRNRKYRLVAVDCPNVILDEIPEIYVESCSEKLERELEEQRKEALKMNRNEIKQGDKVRVSKDAPKMYLRGLAYFFIEDDCKVDMVEGDNAVITNGPRIIAIPTKYLIKVDAEAKEAKFKVGDRVMHKGVLRSVDRIDTTTNRCLLSNLYYYAEWVKESDLDPYTEPTEQTETEKPNHTITIPVEVDLTDSYWDTYAADLAKEVVLKTVNSASDRHPMAIAEYATDIAKAVVEGLKRK